ncbi:hypothetical protein [Nocardioides sp. TRM66260-LWL]|uniref:hypothetical protein n=1 Tax=Nocardioides sp. TRM66260-LWL TaxID=2874478 RepID=UPI0035B4A0F0
MNAMLHQISPQKAIANFEKIADASSALISTSIPASQFGTFASLALKARGATVSTLSLVPPLINTGDPDFALTHRKVASTIAAAEGKAKAKPKTVRAAGAGSAGAGSAGAGSGASGSTDQPITGGSVGTLKTGYVANESDDRGSAC